MAMNKKLTLGLSVLIASTSGCSKPTSPPAPAAVPVRVVEAEHLHAGNLQRYSASITPNAQVDLVFKSGGYVGSMHQVRGADGRMRAVDAGDFVRAGTVLASVRSTEYHDRIQEAEADLAKAKATDELATLTLKRISTLFSTGSATKPEYDQAQADIERSDAAVKQANAELSVARTQLADSVLVAPRDGWITARNINVGSLVGGSVTAFSLIDTHLVRASFGVPDTEMNRVHLGDKLQVDTEAVGDFSGRVTSVSPSADSKTRVYSVEVTLANTDGRLKAGMIATLALEGSRPQEITAIPLAAVLRSPQDPNALLVMMPQPVADGYVARPRTVQLGDTYGNSIAVTSGLQPGDPVITTGASLVHDGNRLQLIH